MCLTVENIYHTRHEELDRYMREKEAAISKVREGALEREHQLEEKVRELQAALEAAQLTVKQLEWNNQDQKRDTDAAIEKLVLAMMTVTMTTWSVDYNINFIEFTFKFTVVLSALQVIHDLMNARS